MNGFAHGILSFMLNWIRALISQLWQLFSGESGGTLYRFLAKSWLGIVAVLCIGGVVVDLIVYFFRWRPDYVWRSRRRFKDRYEEEAEPYEMPEEPAMQPPPPPPAPEPVFQKPVAAAQPTRLWAPVSEESLPEEENFLWDAEEPLDLDWDAPETPAFGMAKPEPAQFYHHIQAGYAPPVPPEQLYQPAPSYRPPVHPGLDEEAVRQTFALQNPENFPPEQAPLVVHAPAFRPFTVREEDVPLKPTGALSRFAKKMGDLVGVADEDHQPTFRDLQSTVDVSQAFHAPVYPQPMNHKEG